MLKKIPTITRPDPAYAASLRPEAEEKQGREEMRRVEETLRSVSVAASVSEKDLAPGPGTSSAPAPRPRQETAVVIAPLAMASSPRTRRIPATRKIDIRVNALERQEEALIDCGVDPAHVIRAALRRAVKNWQLEPDFVALSEEQRTRMVFRVQQKRGGERGEGKWQRISWDQAMSEIADRFIDHSVATGPRSISFDLGTQMVLKRASFAALGRFATISGIELPEAFAGVGDLPTGVQMTVGEPLLGDTMAAVFKSRCCLVWFCNPAVSRPDRRTCQRRGAGNW